MLVSKQLVSSMLQKLTYRHSQGIGFTSVAVFLTRAINSAASKVSYCLGHELVGGALLASELMFLDYMGEEEGMRHITRK